MHKPWILFWAFLCAAGPAPAFSGTIVANGSFEAPIAPTGGALSASIPTGWSSLGNGSSVDIISSGFSGSVAADGSQFVDLIGAINGSGTFPSGLEQDVTLSGGTQYVLSFEYNGARYNDGSATSGATLEYLLGNSIVSGAINVDALNVYSANGAATPWQTLEAQFSVPSSGSYLLKFDTPSGAFASPMLDNVAIAPADGSAAAPLPTSAGGALLLFGGIGLAISIRRAAEKRGL